MDKRFVGAEELLLDSFRLGVRIYRSGFRPDFIVGVWRGGTPVGIAVQECLSHLGVKTDHISIRTSYSGLPSYPEMIEGAENIRVHGMQYLLETLENDHALLIVDDVYSTGLSIQAVLDQLSRKTRENMPEDVRIAVPWCKPAANRTGRLPDFTLHETDEWLVMPYELKGLSLDEIASHKIGLKPIFDQLVTLAQEDGKS